MRITGIALLTLALSGAAAAGQVNKCVDSDGKVTFTQLACPGEHSHERVTVTQSSGGMRIADPLTMAPSEKPAPQRGQAAITVVGSQGSHCGNATDQDVRTAIVRQEVFVGMTAAQATQAWGKPSTINSSSYGGEQWVYRSGKYGAQYLYVDQSGCVTAWN